MKRKIAVIVLTVICLLTCAIGLSACANKTDDKPVAHVHNYVQKNDDSEHWQECTVPDCTEKIKERAAHVYDDAEDAICNVCEYERCIHEWGDWNNNEDSGHSRVCIKCGDTESESHDYDEYYSNSACNAVGEYTFGFCKKCGNVKTSETELHPHDFKIMSPVEATCTECGVSEWVQCDNCGYIPLKHYTAPLGHLPHGDYYFYSEKYHYRNCARCDGNVLSRHRFGNFTVTEKATCTKSGTMSRTCRDCGYTQTKPIAPYHIKRYGEFTVEPTCTLNGERRWTCTRCDATGVDPVPALGHDKIYGEPTVEPTCTEQGERPWTCERCNETGTEPISASGHDWDIKVIKEPTCTEYGEREKTCKICGETEPERIPPSHSFDNGTEIEPATCTESGKMLYGCNRCDHSEIIDTLPLGHDYSEITNEPTCTEDGYELKICSRCGDVTDEEFTPALGHVLEWKYDEDSHWEACKRRDCDYTTKPVAHTIVMKVVSERKDGEYLHRLVWGCECGYIQTEVSVIHEHESVELRYNPEPTCTESGFVSLVCKTAGCGFVYDAREVSPLGHNFELEDMDCQCTRCGVWYCDVYQTIGLDYRLNDDNQSYLVCGLGEAYNETNIVIAHTYNGLPVTSISNSAFGNYGLLMSVTIPSGVKSIGEGAFGNCRSLASITIPNGVINIGGYAFEWCTGLASVTIPSSVINIGESAFIVFNTLTIYCEAKSKPDGWHNEWCWLSEYDYFSRAIVWNCRYNDKDDNGYAYAVIDGIRYALKDGEAIVIKQPSNITIANIPAKVTYRSNLYSVTSIVDYAFDECVNLTSVTIPNSVMSIGNYVFRPYNKNMNVSVASENIKYHSAGNCIIETATKTLVAGFNNSVIPTDGSVTRIGDRAFDSCEGLKNITIPDSVISIGDYAFEYCTGLKSITIPNSVTNIGYWVFNDCSSLTNITFNGTIEQWKAITKDTYWNIGLGNFIIICTDGKLDKDGNEIVAK